MIQICGDVVRNKILNDIRNSQFFSVIADEATDAANQEQLSICVRYWNESTQTLDEKFLGFWKCDTGVTGEAIAEDILTQLSSWRLSADLLRGQAYDGAGAMSGMHKGAAARILHKYPKALYTHCAAHRLNLCIVQCCSNRDITNMMSCVDSIARFFNNSPKRQHCLEKWITDVTPATEKRHKLKELCRTRWVERHEAYEVFIDLFMPIVSCLEEIVQSPPTEWNRDTRIDAQSHLLSVSHFLFL